MENAHLMLEGCEVRLNSLLTETRFVVREPSRFIEYEEKDKSWLAFFDMGYYEQVPSNQVYVMEEEAFFGKARGKKVLVMHPATWEVVKKELERRARQREDLFLGSIQRVRLSI